MCEHCHWPLTAALSYVRIRCAELVEEELVPLRELQHLGQLAREAVENPKIMLAPGGLEVRLREIGRLDRLPEDSEGCHPVDHGR